MSTKISALPASAGLVLTDIFPVVDDPGGVPVTEKATFTQLQTLLSAGMVASFNTRVGAVTLTLADVSTVADARYVLKAGDTMTGALLIGNGSIVADTPVLSLSQTWNNAAVAFTALKLNVTNTASDAGSFLIDLQQDSVTRFQITNGGVNARFVSQAQTNTAQQLFLRKQGNSVSATGAIATASGLGTLFFSGYNGTAFVQPASIRAISLEAFGVANAGTKMDFFTNPIGSSGSSIVLSMTSAGIIFSTSIILPYVAKTATYTASAVDYTIDCTANTFTIDLPTAVGITGRVYVIKNSGVGTITIDPSGAQTIDGLATSPVTAGGAAMIQSNGANWIII